MGKMLLPINNERTIMGKEPCEYSACGSPDKNPKGLWLQEISELFMLLADRHDCA